MEELIISQMIETLVTMILTKMGYNASTAAVRQSVMENSLRREFDKIVADLSKDVNRVNAMIEALRDKNNDLLLDLAYSSPVGSRIVAITKKIAAGRKQLETRQKEALAIQNRIADKEKQREDAVQELSELNAIKTANKNILGFSKKPSNEVREKTLQLNESIKSKQLGLQNDDLPTLLTPNEINGGH